MAVESRILRFKVSTKHVWFTALLCFGIVIFHMTGSDTGQPSPSVILFFCALITVGAYSVVKAISLMVKRPVVLRSDDQGFSGYILKFPLEWSDIAGFEVTERAENADAWTIRLSVIGAERHKTKRQVSQHHKAGVMSYRIQSDIDLLSMDAAEVVQLLETHLADSKTRDKPRGAL